jgi:hypothetical protein
MNTKILGATQFNTLQKNIGDSKQSKLKIEPT